MYNNQKKTNNHIPLKNNSVDNIHNNFSAIRIIQRLINDHLKPYKRQVLMAMFFMVIVAFCSAYIVNSVKPAIDDVLLAKDEQKLIYLPLLMLFVYSIKGICEYFQNFLVKYVGQQILTSLQIKMYSHLLHSDLSFIQSYSSGKLISRFTNDIMIMKNAITNMIVACAKHLLSVIFLVFIMFYLDYVLSLIVFVIFPAAAYPIQKMAKRMRKLTTQTQEELSIYTSKLDETFSAIKIIKSFSSENIETRRANKIIYNILKLYKKAAKLDALTSPLMEILSGFAIACILWYGGLMVINNTTTPGAIFAFITAFVSAYRPFKSLVSLNMNLQEGLSAANRVFNILDTKPIITDRNEIKLQKSPDQKKSNINFLSDINLHSVYLYLNKRLILDNISLNIKSGKIHAIVGRSGSGKSSIINLICRFYD
ncbi:MAG TPA: ABC transporter transmembrane domain-containing protein, partial [Candidatus Megaira endosymbiont of Hartmannula sinica]|nr:ABC transporter transmembrane domain-containing protein [Candidatus Megaera endosymbiont of Hartmannula sinica]